MNQYLDFSSRACNLYIIILPCPVKQKTENFPKTREFSKSVWMRWPSLTRHRCHHCSHWLGPEEQPGFLWACADWAHENLLLSLSSNRPLSSFEQGEKGNGNMKNLYIINQHPGSWNRLSRGVSRVPQTQAQRPRLLGTRAPQCSLPHRFPWHKTDLQWHWLVWLGWKSGEDVYKCSQEATRSDFRADICSLTSLDLSSINTDVGDSLLLSW